MLFQSHPRKGAVNYLQCSTWNRSLITNICPRFPILSAHNIVLTDALSATVSLVDLERWAVCAPSLHMLATDCGYDSVVKASADQSLDPQHAHRTQRRYKAKSHRRRKSYVCHGIPRKYTCTLTCTYTYAPALRTCKSHTHAHTTWCGGQDTGIRLK